MPREIKATIHCTATKNGEYVGINIIREWHLAKGWSDIGYHYVINSDGSVNQGRGLNKEGAHVEGHNKDNIGICLVGNDRFSVRQFDSLRDYLDSLAQLFDLKSYNIFCHYQFDSAQKQGKTCPNIPINNLLSWYLGNEREAIKPYLLGGD